MTATAVNTIDISFSNKNKAKAVFPSDTDSIESIDESLAIPDYKSILLVLGGADSIETEIKSKLSQLFDRGIAKAVIHVGALVVDGGTMSGVMQLMGEALASRDAKIKLVGIAPESLIIYPASKTNGTTTLVELEPNHSHFVLTSGKQWGDESIILYELIKHWRHQKKSIPSSKKAGNKSVGNAVVKIPCLALLAGGGLNSKKEVLFAVRKNIPLLIIAGSGGLADEIAKSFADKTTDSSDRQLTEIIADGDIQIIQLNHSVKNIERLIVRKLSVDNLLMQAWESFANYDKNATRHQKTFNQLQKCIFWIGIIGTALVIVQQLLKPDGSYGREQYLVTIARGIIYYILLIIPITLTCLLTVYNKFKPGNKWLLLRSGAEAIKREIYKYRVRTGAYANDSENQLSKAVEVITRRIMRTEVNTSAIIPYAGPIPPDIYGANKADDGLSTLTPDQYVELRLNDQVNYYTRRSQALEKRLRYFSYLAYVTGGIGTFLVAIGFQLWLPLTTAIITAVATYFGYSQTENTLIKYNQTEEDLKNVRKWWHALKPEDQADPININSLVEHTEQILQSETDGWIQQMQNVLENLRKPGEKSGEDERQEQN